ncbi:MAG: MerC domain-containing protein [Bdellovibrionales bacterium]|nr:MerC domain-containing protein [Bdellovibrionales bacterium]
MEQKGMSDHHLIGHSKKWDRSGIIVATLCLVHCLALPLLVGVLPALSLIRHHWVEIIVLALGVIIGSISFVTSYKRHRIIYPLILGMIGILFLCISLLQFGAHSEPMHHTTTHWNPWTLLGGLFLITGHLWNIRACHCFCDHDCHHQEHQDIHQHSETCAHHTDSDSAPLENSLGEGQTP